MSGVYVIYAPLLSGGLKSMNIQQLIFHANQEELHFKFFIQAIKYLCVVICFAIF